MFQMRIHILSQGGLGNQLFQAAYAHHLAILYKEVRVNFVNYNSEANRKFELTEFFENCSHVNEVSKFSKRTDLLLRTYKSLVRRFPKYSKILSFAFRISEAKNAYTGVEFELSKLKLINFFKRKLIVIGHFQNSEFTLNNKCFEEAIKTFVEYRSSVSNERYPVVMHIRHGDYFQFTSMGPLSLKYFREVILSRKSEISNLLIHSDTIIENTWTPPSVYPKIDINNNPFNVLLDAGNSNLFIGSNSSLSWWGSYLQRLMGKGGVSIFPNEWMRGESTQNLPLFIEEWHLHKAIWI